MHFWSDNYIENLTPEEKLIFIYYVFNPSINIIHCYHYSIKKTVFDTGLSEEIVKKANIKFQKDRKFLFHKDFIFIVNGSKYQKYTGASNEIAKERKWLQAGTDVLEYFTNYLSNTK